MADDDLCAYVERDPMTDRLAEIEASASAGHHPWWDTGQAPWDLAALVGVVKAARAYLAAHDRNVHHSLLGLYRDDLRAALANLEGGA